jgi:predicted DNA-binding transcriptional regulator AlpA
MNMSRGLFSPSASLTVKRNRTSSQPRQGPEDLLKPGRAAELLGISKSTLQSWRLAGTGPRFIRISARAVRYRLRDLEAWIARRERGGPDEQANRRRDHARGGS